MMRWHFRRLLSTEFPMLIATFDGSAVQDLTVLCFYYTGFFFWFFFLVVDSLLHLRRSGFKIQCLVQGHCNM